MLPNAGFGRSACTCADVSPAGHTTVSGHTGAFMFLVRSEWSVRDQVNVAVRTVLGLICRSRLVADCIEYGVLISPTIRKGRLVSGTRVPSCAAVGTFVTPFAVNTAWPRKLAWLFV